MTTTSRIFFAIAFVLWTIVIFMTCNKAYGQANPDFKVTSSMPSDSVKWHRGISGHVSPNIVDSTQVFICDGSCTQPAARREPSGHWIVTNDTLALEQLYKVTKDLQDERELMREIIRYLNRDGSITNLKRYKAACDAYIRWQKRGKRGS